MIGYLGPEGSYSYYAGTTFYVKEELVSYNNIGRLFYALEHDEVTGIVLPFETMKFGTSFDVLGRVHKHHYHISKEILMDIVLSIVSSGFDPSSIREIYATEHSINECYNTLKAELGKYVKKYVTTNQQALEAVRKAETEHVGAVLSNHEMLEDLHVVVNDIRDVHENTHKFVLVEKNLKVSGFHNRTLIACSPKKEQGGALYDLLHEFVFRGCNIIKILSTPHFTSDQPMIFYIELEGNLEQENIADALAMVTMKSKFVSILGSYYAK